jgi:hypothetical protein
MLPYHAPAGTPFASPAPRRRTVSPKASGHEETRKPEGNRGILISIFREMEKIYLRQSVTSSIR